MGAGVEARHEALREGRVSAPDVVGHKGIVEPFGRRRHVDTEGQYNLLHRCTDAPCAIGKKVLFGPHPTIITGDHRIDVLGKYIADVTVEEKFVNGENHYDQPVTIEDDVWCGANVTILKGVTIGRGSVVAAGAVVTKSFPPYSIIGGVPAKLLKMRFTEEEIKKHEEAL